MAQPPIALLVAAGAAFYFLSKGDKDKPEPEVAPAPAPTPAPTPAPAPTPTPTPAPAPTPTPTPTPTPAPVVWEYDAKTRQGWIDNALYTDKATSGSFTIDDFDPLLEMGDVAWVSRDCKKAFIGKDWSPVVRMDGVFLRPDTFFNRYGGGNNPNVAKTFDMSVGPALQYTYFLFRGPDGDSNISISDECYAMIPQKSEYSDAKEWENAWSHFLLSSKTIVLHRLFLKLYDAVLDDMLDQWHLDNPDAWTESAANYHAREAFAAYPSQSISDITDAAYFKLFPVSNAYPIDPNNAAHQNYLEAWLFINEIVTDLKNG